MVEALVGDDRATAEAAYVELQRRVRRSRHPRVLRATPAELADLVQEVALLLTREPAAAAVESIHTWSGLTTAIHRWIDQCRGESIEDRANAYHEHLWKKTGAVLLHSGRFTSFKVGSVLCYALAHRPVAAQGLASEALKSLLPPLAARLHAARADQLGEVVAHDDLVAQLERIFTLGANTPRSRAFLVDAVFASLAIARGPAVEPLADEETASAPTHAEHADPAGALADRDATRLAQLFVDALPPRTRTAARLRFANLDDGPRSLEEVGRHLGVSRGTAENEVGDARGRFGAAWRELVAREDLSDDEQVRILTRVVEILCADAFVPNEEASS